MRRRPCGARARQQLEAAERVELSFHQGRPRKTLRVAQRGQRRKFLKGPRLRKVPRFLNLALPLLLFPLDSCPGRRGDPGGGAKGDRGAHRGGRGKAFHRALSRYHATHTVERTGRKGQTTIAQNRTEQ